MQPQHKEEIRQEIDHKDLWYEIMLIKDNHLKHLKEDVDDLRDAVKDNRSFFQQRLDRLDNRIWWVLGLSVSTMITVLLAVFGAE